MKYFFCLFLSISFLKLHAQYSERYVAARAQFYDIGMAHSIAYFDSIQSSNVQLRQNNKLDENNFLERYRSTDIIYQEQSRQVAIVAAKLAMLQSQRPSKNVKAVLSLILKNKISAAIDMLYAKKNQLNSIEQDLLIDLFKYSGKVAQINKVTPKNVSDSLDLIWQNKFVVFSGTDTSAFILKKMYIADKFLEHNEIESAIGTLLEAQQWAEQMKIKNTSDRLTEANLAYKLSTLQYKKVDVDNAYRNAQKSVQLYNLLLQENINAQFAAANYQLALVYSLAGANKEADTFFKKTILLYELLVQDYPQLYEPVIARVYKDYSVIQQYFDKNEDYEHNIRNIIALYSKLSKSNFPFYQFELGKNFHTLGIKKMNVDVKIFLAQEEWANAQKVLENVYKRLPMLAGDELCAVLYKLGGAKIALKKGTESRTFFNQSLNVRTQLYNLSPSINQKDYIDILVQNATLNALDSKKEIAVLQLDRAIKIAEQIGETKRAEEIRKFKKGVQTH